MDEYKRDLMKVHVLLIQRYQLQFNDLVMLYIAIQNFFCPATMTTDVVYHALLNSPSWRASFIS